jgi:hypothetical protein
LAKAHCSTCDAEVEAIDGVCLLGHPVGERSRLDDLRAEIERAFEAASREVAAVLTGEIPVVPATAAEPVSLERPVRTRQVTEPLRVDTPVLTAARTETPLPAAPPTSYQAPAAAAPPPPPGRLDVEKMWEKANAPGDDDPINAFAPPPRLDWGPEAKKGLRRRIEG